MFLLIVLIIGIFFYEPRWYNNIFLLAFVLFTELLYYTEQIFFNENFSEHVLEITGSLFIFAFIPFVMFALSILTFFNSKVLLEKEGRKKSNLFLGLIGVATMGTMIYYIISMHSFDGSPIKLVVFAYIFGLFIYFSLIYTATALYAFLYNVRPKFYTPDYIIILGSGLIGDKVPPLLASRINKAVEQYRKYNGKPLIITSGGQGSDEKVSESYAMKKYIHEHYPDIPDMAVVMEDQSTTTLENMLFSKKIIENRFGKNANGLFVSNNYHILRAGFYAKRAKLKAHGVGAKTAFYYVPNAFTREFIGLLEMFKWRHIVLLSLYTIFMLFVLKAQM